MSTFRFGMFVWPQIAIEAQFNQSQGSDKLFRFDVDIEETKALYAKFVSREYNEITMDVSLGYASTTLAVKGSEGLFSGTDDYDGFSWGIAANQKMRSLPNASFRIAYTSFYDDEKLHIRGFSLGFTYHFN